MTQRLRLPIDDAVLNAGYKMPRYTSQWGYQHYGADFGSASKKRTIFGMGNGTVVACGIDGGTAQDRLGNCIVVVYPAVLLGDGCTVTSLACRMFHLEKICCSVGDSVSPTTILGQYGSTGAHTTGPHLHLEFDTDTKYPCHAVGIAASGNVIQKGSIDSTLDPCKVLWRTKSQSITATQSNISSGWVAKDSLLVPLLPTTVSLEYLVQQLVQSGIDTIELKG